MFDLSKALPFEVTLPSGEKIVVRVVREDEEDRVWEISKGVYDFAGTPPADYVPSFFQRWIHSSNHLVIGIEVDGVLEGLNCITIIDDKKTIWKEGLRINATARGRRLLQHLANGTFYYEQLTLLPTVTRVRYSKYIKDKKEIQKELDLYPGTEVIDVRESILFLPDDSFKHHAKKIASEWTNKLKFTDHATKQIGADAAFKILSKDHSLLSNNVITSDWISYELSKRNLFILENGGMGCWERKFYTIEKGNRLSSLAFCSFSPRVGGLFKYIEIFSESLDDVKHFIAHFLADDSKLNPSNIEPCAVLVWVSERICALPEFQEFIAPLNSRLTRECATFSCNVTPTTHSRL